jgi:hypothetical protein
MAVIAFSAHLQPGRRRPGFFVREAACIPGMHAYLGRKRCSTGRRSHSSSLARSEMAGLFRARGVHENSPTADQLAGVLVSRGLN